MAKNEQRFNFELYDSKHLKNLQKRTNEIVKMFNDAATQGARACASSGFSDGKKPFYIDDYPAVKRRIDEVINELHDGIVLTIEEGERDEWLLSCEKNDKMVDAVTSSAGLSKAQISQWKQRNLESLTAFQSRKIGGMGLSKRVWNLTDQFRQELELALDLGLGEGKSAAELSRDVRRYLNEPHKLFRRVRDKHGVLRLSKAAKAYHPGQGVYRSSYKNAMRLTRTEINMAYRTADHERWAAIPFVLGTEIVCSNNHPVADICDTLAGVYPKDFKWTGWHPQCRCIALPYLAKGEEIDKYHEKMLNGEDVEDFRFSGAVNDVPQKFKTWLTDNTERIENAKQQPYFISDNQRYINRTMRKKRTRTAEERQAIIQKWNERKAENRRTMNVANSVLKVAQGYGEVDYSLLEKYIAEKNIAKMRSATKEVAQEVLAMKKQEAALVDLIPNVHTLHLSNPLRELQEAHSELSGVMARWLKKYRYSSLDSAELNHLRNKLTFELTSPSIAYKHKNIIKDAITEKIKLVNRKIEWDELVAKVDSLKAFKTKSSIFKDCLTDIDGAIKKNDLAALQNSINKAEAQRQKLIAQQAKRGGATKSALNKEYQGGAIGKDLTASIDTRKMKSEDPYGGTYTNNVARMQGFDVPAKLVSAREFEDLAAANGDVFFRTVNPTEFRGKKMSSKEFASQIYTADKLELNGSGGRVYGDGMYVASSAWNGRKAIPLTDASRKTAYRESAAYGDYGKFTTLEMTWTRTPKIIKQSDLRDMWDKLSYEQQGLFGYHENTYACALGYDAMYCSGPNYIVIWNRSILAVKKP